MSTSMSGIALDAAIATTFNDIKLKHTHSYMQMKITDDKKTIEIEKLVETATYDEFLCELPPKSCRYVIFDYKGEGDRINIDKLILIVWCPDTASIKEKMIYAASKEAVKSVCKGNIVEIQANDSDQVSREEVEDKLFKK